MTAESPTTRDGPDGQAAIIAGRMFDMAARISSRGESPEPMPALARMRRFRVASAACRLAATRP